MSNRTCCVCTEPGKPTQIHHIDENPSNNSIENLAVLCLHCHECTQISGGFGRKLDAAQVSKFREQWLIRVHFRRHKADEDSIKAVTIKDHTAQPAIPLRDYIPVLPEFLKRAYDNALEGWEGTTADMLNSSYYVADVLEGMLVYLSSFYPDGHFDQRDPRDYISEVVSNLYSWHRHHMEPEGGGSGGTMIGPMVAMNVISDLRSMVDDMVSSLAGDPKNHIKFNFLEWRAKWESVAGEAKESSVHLTVEGQTLLKKAAIGENGSILKTTGTYGITITTDRFEIRASDPPRIKAKYLKAFNDLVTHQLITACDSDENLFQITDLGYKLADSITIAEDEKIEIVKFDDNAGFMGRVAIEHYKSSKEYIWLTANDLDSYDEEYLASLKDACKRGVTVRRIITVRQDAPPDFYDWYFDQIGLTGFDHRVYSKPIKECLFDLNIIDGKTCVMYLPQNQIECSVFRHVLVIANPVVVDRFQQIYQMMWTNAKPVQTKEEAVAFQRSLTSSKKSEGG